MLPSSIHRLQIYRHFGESGPAVLSDQLADSPLPQTAADYVTIPASILSSESTVARSTEQIPISHNSLSLIDAGNIPVPFASSSTYQMPNTSSSVNQTMDASFPPFPSSSTSAFSNMETFRLPHSFTAPVVSVAPNHISPSASDGQRSTSSQPTQRNQRHQSLEDGLIRNASAPENEKSPHVFTSVRS